MLSPARWALVVAAIVACSCGGNSNRPPNDTDGGADGNPFGVGHTLTGVAVDPPSATLDIVNDKIVTQAFTARALFADGSSEPLTSGLSWSSNFPAAGAIDASGTFTPTAQVGGPVNVTATYQKLKGSASVAVKLHYAQNPANAQGPVQSALLGATTKDPSCTWAYPYDGTVFPRGLAAPTLMWNGGGASDVYYLHLTSTYFELTSFLAAPPPARFAADDNLWTKFVNSTSGKANLVMNRWDGNAATTLVNHTWTIAPGSMRGTVYYWANNLGRVMRIKPGAAAPDDFLATAGVTGCSTCHAVSADGSTLVIGGDVATSKFDLKGNTTAFSGMGRTWAQPALSPDGKYLVQNSSPLPGPPGGQDGLWYTANGQRVPSSGLDGFHLGMPAFAPDGTKLVYRDEAGGPTPGSLRIFDFDPKNAKASNDHELIKPGGNASLATIGFPTVSPDANWIVYARGTTIDTRSGTDDLYIANAATPGVEARLAKLNGDGYPFAAGSRDLAWNFEPTFAPVASGGYFWIVLTGRRTYGNELTGSKDAVKQLWVAAIDEKPINGQDASHPAFRLPGQAIDSLNMRGFWALDPCKQDGQTCGSGTECCGGYCDSSSDGGAPICKSINNGCSQDGDHCDISEDCCNASSGVSCINHVCSEPPPN